MDFKIISDHDECERLWKQFSPNKEWWDLWEVRECFIKNNQDNPLHFIVGYNNGELAGFLPLWHNVEEKYYTNIGNDYPENNRIFLVDKTDKTTVPLLLEQCPKNTFLYFMDAGVIQNYSFKEAWEHKYYLDLTQFKTIDDYLATFSRKHRKNVRHDVKYVIQDGSIARINGQEADYMETMSKYSIEHFGTESLFLNKKFINSMIDMFALAKERNGLMVIEALKDGIVVGGMVSLFYNGIYAVILNGVDSKIDNVGKLLLYEHIKNAIAIGAKKFDMMTGCEWKDLWNFSLEKMYEWGDETLL